MLPILLLVLVLDCQTVTVDHETGTPQIVESVGVNPRLGVEGHYLVVTDEYEDDVSDGWSVDVSDPTIETVTVCTDGSVAFDRMQSAETIVLSGPLEVWRPWFGHNPV